MADYLADPKVYWDLEHCGCTMEEEEFIPFRLLQENKQELCKKILSLEQEIDDLREQNSILKRKLKKKPTTSTTPSSPPPKKET